MDLLLMVIRKMVNNKWMVICLLVGTILAVAMVSSIPMYTDGVLQRMLIRDLESFQLSSNYYPGRYQIVADLFTHYEQENRLPAYQVFNKRVNEEMVKEVGLPWITTTQQLTVDYMVAVPEKQREESPKRRFLKIEGIEGYRDHMKILHGKMPSSQKVNGVYEVVVNEEVMKRFDLLLDEVYNVTDISNRTKNTYKFKVVGVYTLKDPEDAFWFDGIWAYNESMLMDYELLKNDFVFSEPSLITDAQWYYAFDYHKITLNNLQQIVSTFQSQQKAMKKYIGIDYRVPALSIFEKYNEREKQLRTTLWVLQVPILLMLAFYIFMVSQLIIDHERNEIAVLKSRGASTFQIFISYLIESLIVSGIALLLGPPLGLLLCRIIGASNGFLEFVQRTALPITISLKVYLYSLIAAVFTIITMLIPAFLSSRTTIVEYKRNRARVQKTAFWKKYFLDVLLLAVAGYGLYTYQMRQKTLAVTGATAGDLPIDPLLFLISTLFVLGIGLVFLRIYPYIIRLVFWLGRKIWSPVLYASFIQVGRSRGQEQFLMLFIILTLSVGLFNANAARTINRNIEEKIKYEIGADITITSEWPNNIPAQASSGPMGSDMGGLLTKKEPVIYMEPPFAPYETLAGSETVTKVFRRDDVYFNVSGESPAKVYFMGINPNEFGKVSWFRPDLLPYHWYQYLNLLASNQQALLVSSSLKEKFKLTEGDSVYLSWGDQDYLEGVIYAFVDYWPTYNPHSEENPDLVVANLSYVQAKMAMEPYEVWLKKAPGATSQQIYEDIEKKNLNITSLQDTSQKIIEKKNDPLLQGTNGALTLGFIVTMGISTIGFIIYWILSIQGRVLQFGIFRAMGLSMRRLLGLLIWEQVLISGIAIFVGIMIGGITSDYFVPLLQLVYSSAQQVPPFKVVADARDYIKLYIIVGVMLLSGFTVLGIIVSRLNISQAIKLGED